MSSTKSSLSVALASLILAAAGQAAAQTCASDKDCPQGHACRMTTVAQPEPGCTRPPNGGSECVTPDASPPAPVVISSCEPKSCNADADCGAGMICYAQTSTECSGGAAVACPEDRPCDAGPPVKEMCTTRTIKMCAFSWQLPCNANSDCGAGFTCKPTEIGSCSGSTPGTGGGSSGSGGGAAPQPDPAVPVAPPRDAGAAPPPPMCTTMTSYPGWCAPTVTSCTTDADCPALWKCLDNPETPVSSGEGRPGFVAPPAPDAGAAKKTCQSSLSGGPAGAPTRGGKDEGATNTGPTPGGGGSTSGEAPPVGRPVSGADAGTQTTPTKSGGCSMAAQAGASGAAVVATALLGLVMAVRRRRRRV